MSSEIVTVVTKGIVVKVLESQLEELRSLNISWFSYSQARLTRSHKETVEFLIGESK